jgi:hypothetical protein
MFLLLNPPSWSDFFGGSLMNGLPQITGGLNFNNVFLTVVRFSAEYVLDYIL